MNNLKNEKEAIEYIKNYNNIKKKLEKLTHDDYAGKKEKSNEYPIKWLFMTEEEIKKDAEKRGIVSWDSGETRKYYEFFKENK